MQRALRFLQTNKWWRLPKFKAYFYSVRNGRSGHKLPLDLIHGQFSLPIRLNWDWKYALNFGDLYGMQIYILHASMSDNKFWLERFKFYCMITLAFWFVILIFTRNENNNAFFGQDFTPLHRGLTYKFLVRLDNESIRRINLSRVHFFCDFYPITSNFLE